VRRHWPWRIPGRHRDGAVGGTGSGGGRLGRRLEQRAEDLGTDSSVRVGIDLVAVDEVAESVRRFGDRYLNRDLHPHELASCRAGRGGSGPGGGYSAGVTGRPLRAKEAVVKVLRPVGPRPEWRAIEVHRSDAGWCGIRLGGRAADLAAEAHLGEFTVSLTHESMMAVAIVMATVEDGSGSTPRSGPRTRAPRNRERRDHGRDHPDVLAEHGKLGVDANSIEEDADLFASGMTSTPAST